jgi:hypothetical protein
MIVFDLNVLVSEYNYSELFVTDKSLDMTLTLTHNLRSIAKDKRDIIKYERCNDDIDTLLMNKDTVKSALMIKERSSVQIFKNRLIGIHYLN